MLFRSVVIKLVVMTSSSFLFSFLISSAFSAIEHEVSDIHRGLTCNMQYAICNMQYYNIQYILLTSMDKNRAKFLQGLLCETPNCCETLFDSCDLCKQGLCEVCYQGYHLCINNENFGDVNSDGNLVDDSNCFDDDNQSTISGSMRSTPGNLLKNVI